MRILFLGVLFLLSGWNARGQKADYARALHFEQRFQGGLTRNSLNIFPQFLPGSDQFWYTFRTEEGVAYYFVDPGKRKRELLFDNAILVQAISEITRKTYSNTTLDLSGLVFSKDGKMFSFNFDGLRFEYNRITKEVKQVERMANPEGGYSYMVYSPDSSYYVFAMNHNLYMRGNPRKGKDPEAVQLTTDGEEFYSYAADVSEDPRVESRSKARWFATGDKLYVVRSDDRKVNDSYLLDVQAKPRPKLVHYKAELAGDKRVTQYEILVIDINTKEIVRLKTDKWQDQYVSVLYAGKKGDKLYFERIRRTWEEMDICVADTRTGESKVLINEVDKPYINYHIRGFRFLNDGEEILMRSERTGRGHYYLFDRDGRLKNAVTSGDWVAGSVVQVDEAKRELYVLGYGEKQKEGVEPYYAMLYRVSLDGKQQELLTPEDAMHKITMFDSFEYFLDSYSRVDQAPRFLVKDRKGKVVVELSRPDLRRLYESGWKKPERFKVKAADGETDLYGVMWKPFDFDSTRRYPIISAVYPGPHTEHVEKGFVMNDGYNTKLAQLGFIVISVGHRGGTPLRGKKYMTYGYGNFRDHALADDKCAIEQLADRHSYIDVSKVGIFGHSGGGMMAAAAICVYPDFYKAAVASAGNHDNNMYNKGWVEIHGGVQEKKQVVKDSAGAEHEESVFSVRMATNMDLVQKLKGHLMLVTGDMDNTVHPAHTMKMADALIKAGKNFELVILPGNTHGFSGSGDHFYERKLWFHFARYLLGDEAGFTDIDDLKEN